MELTYIVIWVIIMGSVVYVVANFTSSEAVDQEESAAVQNESQEQLLVDTQERVMTEKERLDEERFYGER